MKNLAKVIILLLPVLFASSGLGCSSPTQSPIINGSITLSLSGTSSTEAWLNLKAQNLSFPEQIEILINNKAFGNFQIFSVDTIVCLHSLLPNNNYQIEAQFIANNKKISTNKLTVKTLDTTSSNFAWQKYSFGAPGAGSSVLYDVAIINESDIWAVGQIYMDDSTGQPDSRVYNLAVWDGKNWQLHQIPFLYNGKNFYSPIYSIYAFNKNDIWLGIGGVIHWDGTNFQSVKIPDNIFPSRANKIWGISSNNLYIVGNSGNIVHFQNGYWRKIESGTNLNINDIWGDFNQQTGKYEIIAIAANVGSSLDRKILNIDPETNIVTKLSSLPIEGSLSSVWFKSGAKYYVTGGAGNFEKHNLSGSGWENSNISISHYAILNIRANGLNDVFGAGGAGEIIHFNGMATTSYFNSTKLSYGNYYSIATKENIVVAVGEDSPSAVLIMGNR